MVVDLCFEDLFDSFCTTNITLPKYKEQKLGLEFHNEGQTTTEYASKSPILPFAASEVIYSKVLDSKRLVTEREGFKAVYEITFDVEGSNLNYYPGDTIGIIPQNNDEEIEDLLKILSLTGEADKPLTISAENCTKIPPHIPVRSTLRHILTYCIDLRSIVKKLYLLELSQHTSDKQEKLVLQYLSSKQGSAMYTQHVLSKKITFLNILKTFKSCKPPMGVVLAHSTRLLPRPYSIMNSINTNKNIIKICFSVDKNKGLVTGWLEKMILNNNLVNAMKNLSIKISKDGFVVPIYLRKNMGFLLPENAKKLIFIGAGTGVAPFIGFLEGNLNKNFVIWLYNGCRNPNIDCLYKHELEEFLKNGVLSKLRTAASRTENGGVKYVQDAINEDSEEIVKFIRAGAIVCVCGDYAKMASQVRETIVTCFVTHEKLTREDAESLVSDMEKGEKYLVDIWS